MSKYFECEHGAILCANSHLQSTFDAVFAITGSVPLIVADPPYGGIVNSKWDKLTDVDAFVFDYSQAFLMWSHAMVARGALYVWGGIGKPNARPFYKIIDALERYELRMANMITWSKKRAIGTQNNYLFTREELAWFVKGDHKKPHIFNVPYLEKERGYAGFNAKYPCKDSRLRRTNVWTDITEMFRGKDHPTQKPSRLHEVIIETHTNAGDWVIDPYAGTGCTAVAALKTGRKFVLIEQDVSHCEKAKQKILKLIEK